MMYILKNFRKVNSSTNFEKTLSYSGKEDFYMNTKVSC